MHRRLPAVVLIVLGIIGLLAGATGLVLARLGETTWAPEVQHRATLDLKDPGPAVVIDPGVLYAGGHRGTLSVTGPGDVSVIAADPADVKAYLGDAHYTRITGVPTWSTLTAKAENPQGPTDLTGIAQADIWPATVASGTSRASVDIADVWKAENDPPRPYRAILLVTDGKQAGASQVTITWPSEEVNEWVPTAYLAGAIAAALGLILLVAGLLLRRRGRRGGGDRLRRTGVEDGASRRRGRRGGSRRAVTATSSAAAAGIAATEKDDDAPEGPSAATTAGETAEGETTERIDPWTSSSSTEESADGAHRSRGSSAWTEGEDR